VGLVEALIWLHGEGFQRVIVQLDSKAILDKINGRILDVTEFEYIQFCKGVLNVNQNYKMLLLEDNQTLLLTPFPGCRKLLC